MTAFSLSGSERQILSGARCVGKADPNEQLEVIVILRRQADAALSGLIDKLNRNEQVAHLTREQFAQKFGAAAQDIAKVEHFAKQHGLHVVSENAASASVILSGTVAQCNAAFNVDLERCTYSYQHRQKTHQGSYRGRTGVLEIPTELKDIVTAVLGLDNRPQARSHFRFRPPFHPAAQGSDVSYTPLQVASLYNFPGNSGAGQCIALIELGGGYQASDLQTYFSGLGITAPTVTAIAVGTGKNQPTGDANSADGEVMLDIEVAGAIASKANIAVYFSPNTDAGFISAVNTAIHDAQNKPSVISISWGGPESSWTQQAMQAFNQTLQAAAAMGVTVCVASGDSGSSDGVSGGSNNVDFPASSPYVLACGGTSLHASAKAITSEVVWNDGAQGGAGGGGVSAVFALPVWQQNLTVTTESGIKSPLTKRGVPDVAGDADPATGYAVRVDGTDTVIGGTSAVAPLWAALVACINSARSGAGSDTKGTSVGFINPKLYQQQAAFHDITQGNNGNFNAEPGWDACTGLGSPDGTKVLSSII
ncbi:peptidase S53 [Glaciimonas sp. GS1]|uniref:Peptidase S53 n=2 Tax=Glaciimonas soli TaxID=2590999 RepID=A0A843YNI3_9BURK|nr:S53 family peptidase [Glaciimonas soli]MQR01025.1 peptidase S53 [Glaciimonas soli]